MATEKGLLLQAPSDDDAPRADAGAFRGGRLARAVGAAVVVGAAGVALLAGLRGARGGAAVSPGAAVGFDAIEEATVAPAAAAVCTDGWDFDFSAVVDYMGSGSAVLIDSDSVSVTIASSPLLPGVAELKLTMETLSFGSLSVDQVVNVDDLHRIRVSKDHDSLCLAYEPAEVEQEDAAAAAARRQCTFRPATLSRAGFQVAPLGALKLSTSAVATVSGVVQTTGSVPVSFVVTGAPFAEAWKSDEDWKGLEGAAKDALAFAAGEGASLSSVAGVANVEGGVFFQASVLAAAAPAGPCQVQAAVAAAVRDGAFQAAVADRVAAAKVKTSGGAVGSAHVAVPGVGMRCSQVDCRNSERREGMSEANCLGVACATTCCEDAWSAKALTWTGKELTALDLGLPAAEAAAPARAAAPFEWKGIPEPKSALVERKPEAVTVADRIYGAPGTVADKLHADKHIFGMRPLGEVFTDGIDFNAELTLGLAPTAFETDQTVVTSPFNAVTLKSSTDGKLLFEGALTSGGKCAVESVPLRAGGAFSKAYKVRLSKDAEECCIETTALPDLGRSERACSKKADGEELFQLLYVSGLASPHALGGIEVKGLAQTSGSLTMSMSIDGVSLEQLKAAGVLGEARHALKEAIGFASGINDVKVHVAFQRGASEAKHANHPILSVRPMKVTTAEAKAEHANKVKLEQILASVSEADGEDAPVDPAAEKRHEEEFQTERLLEKLEAAFERDEGQEEPTVGVAKPPSARASEWDVVRRLQASGSVAVQVTLAGCGASCHVARRNLRAAAANDFIVQRLGRVTGGLGAAAEALSVSDKSAPANPTVCGAVQCDEFTVNANPLRSCYGASCLKTCCEPAKCSEVTCQEGLVKNFLNLHKKCHGEDDCAEKCCLQKCADYDCMAHGGLCGKSCMGWAMAPPTKAKEVCCEERECPCAHTTWAAACRQCMDEKSLCKSVAYDFLHRSPRRLSNLRKPAASSADAAIEHRAGNVSAFFPGGASAEEIAEKEREAGKRIAENLERLHVERRRLADEGAPSARRLGAVEDRIKLLEGMQEKKEAAMALFAANAQPTSSASRSFSLGGHWDTAIAQARSDEGEHEHHVPLGGCLPHVEVPCEYHQTAVFLHHRGHGLKPKAANTVAVLTDTRNAVSCGEDGICYVWDIKTGCAQQAFFPDDPDNRGPVHTVSVMEDAAFILSAGSTRDGEDGVALIWDWIHGVEKTTTSCDGGVFKASCDVPVARFSLLGCSNGWTTMWDWGNGAELLLPYHKRTVTQIVDAIKDRLAGYYKSNWNGWQRWAYSEHMKTKEAFIEFIKGLNWELDLDAAFWEAVDKFYTMHVMGSVNSIAYVRGNQRFVTAGGDGKVRYWDSDSGKQLWHSVFLGAAQNAVSGLPNKMMAVSGGDDGVARLWDLKSGLPIRKFRTIGVDAPIRAVAVFPGGKRFAAGYDDGWVRIFEIYTGMPTCSIWTGSAVRGIAVNPSNPLYQIITANADGYVHVFNPRKSK